MAGLPTRVALCLAAAFAVALAPGALAPPGGREAGPPGGGRPSAVREAVSPPVRVEIRGRLVAAVVAVAADGHGALELPRPPGTVGWWALGARPGAGRGTVLIAGHLDTREYGPGAFAALRHVPRGAAVLVTGADGRAHRYVVTRRRSYAKEALPADLFSATGPPRLALVTCSGAYDRRRHRYAENLVLLGERA
ncbi:class F sortase [Streptomyces caatingaensis]|uniref:class F sortase n=1 Tax=Streptomyces caatingaensis TaxID=1678637 RepID=UPI0006728622|nr:class F sortase [Streptomyces caatingaensis]